MMICHDIVVADVDGITKAARPDTSASIDPLPDLVIGSRLIIEPWTIGSRLIL